MKITQEELAHVAALARLRLSPVMSEKLALEMNDILTYMEKLSALDTTGVPPTSHALEVAGAMREDAARPSLARGKALANAPEHNGESFVVPKVI